MFLEVRGLIFWSCALLLAVANDSPAAEGLLEKVDVFRAGTEGYPVYRIPTLVMTGKGTLIAVCEARQNGGDWAEIDLVYKRSLDGGKTWGPLQILADGTKYTGPQNPAAASHRKGGKQLTCNNPVLIADPEKGLVHALYCVEYSHCFYARSADDGVTFSEPVEITASFEKFRPEYAWSVLAVGPAHGLLLSNGRLLVPVWMSTGKEGGAHRPSCVATIFSDDRGATWQRGDIVVDTPELKNPSETIAVELADGRTMLNIRHEGPEHRRAVSISKDGATGWSKVTLDDQLYEAVCMASILRVSQGAKNRILFASPDPIAAGEKSPSKKRTNLTLRLSDDDAKSWPVNKVLHATASAYSDLAKGSDGMLYCLYERDGHNIVCARFDLNWLMDDKDQTKAPEVK
jgi:sialidase-1